MPKCEACDSPINKSNVVFKDPGVPRKKCRPCFNEARRSGRPPGRPRKDEVRELNPLEEHRLKERLKKAEERIGQLLADLDRADGMGDLRAAAEEATKLVKPITPRERTSRIREGTALALASDWHVEERVMPAQVEGRNEYNPEISRRRMERFFESTRWAMDFSRQAFKIRDLILWFGGDLLTGHIHDDNRESNYMHPVEAIAFLQVHLPVGVRNLLKDPNLELITIPCNVGNHGRNTREMRAATRNETSYEWLLYTTLAQMFKDEPRVRISIAPSSFNYLDVYGRTVRFTHGDTVRYAGGVGGITVPLYKALARWETVRHADLTCLGHFHQLTQLHDLLINGSLIGYNTYAMEQGFRYEPPAQSFSILDPVRFNSIKIPLWVAESEGK